MHSFLIQKIKSHSFQNFVSGVLCQIIAAIFGIIMPRLIITHYGSVLNGLISTVTQMVAYLAIVEMGLSSAALVALYEPMAKHDYVMAGRVVASINRFYHRVAIYFFIGTICGGLFLPFIIEDDIPILTIWLVVVAISGINLVTYIFLGKYRAILQSDNRLYVSNYAKCVGVVLQFGLGILVVALNCNIAFIKIVAVLTGCVEAILLCIYCKKIYPEINIHAEPLEGAIKQRKYILIHQISALVLNNTDILLLTLFGSSLSLVSVYSVYNMIMLLLFNIVTSFLSVRSAVFAKLFVLDQIDELRRRVYRFEGLFIVFVFGIYTCMAVLIMPFVRLYTSNVHDANYDLPIVGTLFSVLGIFRVLRGSYNEIICAIGRYRETKMQAINSVWINIVISVILIQKYQIPGILFGSIVAEIYRTIHCLIYFYRHVFTFNWKITCARIFLNILISAAIYRCMSNLRSGIFDNYLSGLSIMFITSILIIGIISAINLLTNFIAQRFIHA